MKRFGVVFGVLVMLAFSFTTLSAVCANEEPKPEFDINYKKEFPKSIKPPVHFTHEKHFKEHKVACTECHHVYKEGKNTWKEGDKVSTCITCHPADRKVAKAKSKEAGVKIYDLKNAFHKNCKDCHRKAAKEGKKDAPTKCAQCHKKK